MVVFVEVRIGGLCGWVILLEDDCSPSVLGFRRVGLSDWDLLVAFSLFSPLVLSPFSAPCQSERWNDVETRSVDLGN